MFTYTAKCFILFTNKLHSIPTPKSTVFVPSPTAVRLNKVERVESKATLAELLPSWLLSSTVTIVVETIVPLPASPLGHSGTLSGPFVRSFVLQRVKRKQSGRSGTFPQTNTNFLSSLNGFGPWRVGERRREPVHFPSYPLVKCAFPLKWQPLLGVCVCMRLVFYLSGWHNCCGQ